MFAHNADLGIIGVCIFKPVGKPVRVRISHDSDFDYGILARGCWGCARVIGGLLSLPFSLPRIARGLAIAPIASRAITPKSRRKGCIVAAVAAGDHPMDLPSTARSPEAKVQN
jgi:hypothetical protein